MKLRFWRRGACREVSAAQFWALAAGYEAAVKAATSPRRLALVLAPTSPEAMALFAAVIAAGRIAAWFPPRGPQQDPASYLAHQRAAIGRIDPAAIFVPEDALRLVIAAIDPALARITINPEAAVGADGDACRARFHAACAGADTVLIQHSSGTTGIKKAVHITGAMLAGQAASYWPEVGALAGGPEVRVASWLPLYHDMGLMAAFLLPLLRNAAVSMIDPFAWIAHPETLFEMIEADGCNICWMPNFAFRHLVRLKKALAPRALGSMRAWIDCSEACRLDDAADFETAFAGWGVAEGSVVGCYAMAETVFAVSQARPRRASRALAVPAGLAPGQDVLALGAHLIGAGSEVLPEYRRVLSSGAPLPGMSVHVMDGDRLLADGAYGEIAVRADFLFAGYAGQPTPRTADGYFRTGDLGAMVGGDVFVLGRSKEIVIVNGKNLFAGDIEASLAGISGLKPGRIVAFGDDTAQTGSETLVIVAEVDPGAQRPAAQLRAEITRILSEAFLVRPGDVRIVAERWLVKSTSGKISRGENRDKYLNDFRPSRQAAQRMDA